MLAQFLMIIHLLNMLIAIMGETFANCKEVGDLVKVRDHLAFVIDNWYLSPVSIPDKEQLVFIVTAFLVKQETDENELLNNLKEKITNIRQEISDEHNVILKRQQEHELMLHQIQRNQEKFISRNKTKFGLYDTQRLQTFEQAVE